MNEIQSILGMILAKLQLYCKPMDVEGLFFGGLFMFSGKLFRVLLFPRTELCNNMILTGGDVHLRFL